MDIICEILDTDKIAEEKIQSARIQSEQILQSADEKADDMKKQADDEIANHKQEKHNDVDKRISENAKQFNKQCDMKISSFDGIYQQNHEAWENDIVKRIIGL